MARPPKEGLDYFPHDVDASGDSKIEPLIILYGARGYAFYFLHLEYIYRLPTFEIDISDAETRQIFCSKLQITDNEYQQILNSALRHGCFDKELYQTTGRLSSSGIKKRAGMVLKKRVNMQNWYENKVKNQARVSDAETMPKTPQSKVKESKVKNIKDYSCEIENLRQRYDIETLNKIDLYLDVLRTTRSSGKISDSIVFQVYEEMNKHPPIVVKYACATVISKPDLHSKKENYFYGILRNTRSEEADQRLNTKQSTNCKYRDMTDYDPGE